MVVGVPCSLIFWHFCLFIDFRLVVILILVGFGRVSTYASILAGTLPSSENKYFKDESRSEIVRRGEPSGSEVGSEVPCGSPRDLRSTSSVTHLVLVSAYK